MFLTISRPLHRQLLNHLFSGTTEQLAFLLATQTESSEPGLNVEAVHCIPPDGFAVQTAYHLSLTSETRAEMIKWAWDLGASLVEAHSHLDHVDAMFSPTDLAGLREFVPHVWWRLQARPYAALVFSPQGYDALVWTKSPNVAHELTALRVPGQSDQRPTSLSITAMRQYHEHRFRSL